MSELERIEQLEKEIKKLKGLNSEGIESYSFSKITDKKLKELVAIKQMINDTIFDDWFAFELEFSNTLISFLNHLITKNKSLIKSYN
ncbi:MAG: hypothetical protein QM493_00040, partial [Sulfurovum sp.]